MEIVRLQRKVLALDERVLLVEEEALIERMENQHYEAGCARKALVYISDITASRRPERDLDLELRIEQMLVDQCLSHVWRV